MKLIHKDDLTELWWGDSTKFQGEASFVLTNPYADLPAHLTGCPMLICDFVQRKGLAEKRCRSSLTEISKWHNDVNSIWSGNTHCIKIDLSDLMAEDIYFPDELPRRLLNVYRDFYPDMVVWDGFMGRGTVGKVCREMGIPFIGIEKDGVLAAYASEYIQGRVCDE